MLPNFIIIGAMKAGTSSLAHYLRSHPEIFIPVKKELNYYLIGSGALHRGPTEAFE